jgi:type IV pilus assembly protein PilB
VTDSFGVLVTAGLMTEEQASSARAIAHGDILERANAVTGRPVGELFAAIVHGTSQMRATSDLIAERTDPEAVNLLSRERAEALQCIPLRFEGGTLIVAGTIESTRDALKRQTLTQLLGGQSISYLVARQGELDAKIASSYRNEAKIGELAAAADGNTAASLEAGVEMVELFIKQAIQDRASDIHFEPGAYEMAVRCRIDGVLVDRPSIPIEMAPNVISRIKVRATIDISEKRVPQDGQISFTIGARTVDIRVSTLPTIHGEKAVLRILDNSARLDLSSFGMNRQVHQRWTDGFTRPHGMLLVTGPTGSGKSTTLYATLAELATRERNVVTVEDPVEYQMAGVNQVQVHGHGLTFADALRSILRQDPDVILVGEIRDLETAQVAMEAALTGHLVLSSLHTNSAAEASVRLIEMGVEPFLVASVVECALAQRLVRRLCDACREAVEPTREDLELIGFEVPAGTPTTFFVANDAGCSRCSKGYRGRLALYEAAHRTEAMEQFIVSGAVSSPGAKAAAAADGMITLRQDGWLKVAQGLTTAAEILRVTV